MNHFCDYKCSYSQFSDLNQCAEIKANFAVVLRGDILAIRDVAAGLDSLLRKRSGVVIVHQMTSASKLWINEGDEMNGRVP